MICARQFTLFISIAVLTPLIWLSFLARPSLAAEKAVFKQSAISGDSRKSNSTWNEFFHSTQGIFRNKKRYHIEFDYKVTAQAPEANFYSLVRSKGHVVGDQVWQNLSPDKSGGKASFDFTSGSDDQYLIIGIKHRGAISIRNLAITAGDDTVAESLGASWHEESVGCDFATATTAESRALPPPPAGAKDFEIDAPRNPNGPILNLVDFGLIADKDSLLSDGSDRNLLALQKALEKCRELKAARLTVPKGIYRISSGSTMKFEKLNDFVFDGGGATFLFDKIPGGAGIAIDNCARAVFSNFNIDWDWEKDPLASVGRIIAVAPDSSFFEM